MIQMDLIQMDDYPADSCDISPKTFLFSMFHGTRSNFPSINYTPLFTKTSCLKLMTYWRMEEGRKDGGKERKKEGGRKEGKHKGRNKERNKERK